MQEDGGAHCVLSRMTSADNRPLRHMRGRRGGWETKSLGCIGEATQAINANPVRQNRCSACVLLCELMALSSEPASGDLGQLHKQWEKRRCQEIGADLVGFVDRGKVQLDSFVGKVIVGGSRKASGLLFSGNARCNDRGGRRGSGQAADWKEQSRRLDSVREERSFTSEGVPLHLELRVLLERRAQVAFWPRWCLNDRGSGCDCCSRSNVIGNRYHLIARILLVLHKRL
ncbi:hypothetical protein B296_00013561 [Ensete ventricosum]|uniref:Uncharacterized protein n=1 Tax=Ensete ventricosum TaxID=4639 RepID=A0A426ZMG3_ENSVE|nr:hypothetical protein B296_00013561 [Ensete ventricosum]